MLTGSLWVVTGRSSRPQAASCSQAPWVGPKWRISHRRSRAASSPMVRMPSACRRASSLGPMPLILRHGSGQMSGCKSASRTMLMPLGLLNSLAILASSLLGATPMEQVRPVASKMLFCSSRASTRPPSRWPPGTWVKSMNTSSMPRSCMTGAISRMTALKAREQRRYSSKSAGSKRACGHRRAAFIRPMADPTPNCRAA